MFKLLTVSVQKLIERDGPAGINLQLKPKHPWGVVLTGLTHLKQKTGTPRRVVQRTGLGTLLGIQ